MSETQTTRPSLAEMSGENEAGGAPNLVLNVIRLNGSNGKFIYQHVLDGLQEMPDGKKKYKTTEIGDKIDVVFLKVRRKLSQYKKGEKPLQTNEHSHKGQAVTLFGKEKPEVGYAEDIREANPGLRTQQIVYALYKGELVRIIFKGASLMSENKPKTEHNFYSYISSYQGEEHFYEHVTQLYALQESGTLGSYYCVGYKKGEKIPATDMELVADSMYTAFDHCKKVDEYYSKGNVKSFEKKAASPVASSPESSGATSLPDYPESEYGEITDDDIPF